MNVALPSAVISSGLFNGDVNGNPKSGFLKFNTF